MLFNSPVFLFLFLPITLYCFYALGQRGYHQQAIAALVVASLFFYAWWNPLYLVLLCGLLVINYGITRLILTREEPGWRKGWLVVGLLINILILAYFKYANFLVDSLKPLLGLEWSLDPILLPIGISFYTFQKIAYLVDTYHRDAREYRFLQFALFVTFFPQLIAGPIVHHKEVIPQFNNKKMFQFRLDRMEIGLTILAIGLFKKVVLADSLALQASPIFDQAAAGLPISFADAWQAALAYALQLYFDFSGYSDMAVGLARLFGVRLPLNFNSPYKSLSIIEFWRRWHITLSRFLRDYIYIPLGGNRLGKSRRFLNLMITMALGGAWHGAGWTFMLWGILHGLFLIVNHLWRQWYNTHRWAWNHRPTVRWIFWMITLGCVVFSWVTFRSANMSVAMTLWRAMCDVHSDSLKSGTWVLIGIFLLLTWGGFVWQSRRPMANNSMVVKSVSWMQPQGIVAFLSLLVVLVMPWITLGKAWITVAFVIAFWMPNTQQIMRRYSPVLHTPADDLGRSFPWLEWRMTPAWGIVTACLLVTDFFWLTHVSEFLYFRF